MQGFAWFLCLLLQLKIARTGCTSAKSELSAFGLHCPCIVNQNETQMKKRILYVGTLIDLAMIFEPDEEIVQSVTGKSEELESEEFFQSMLNNNNK